MKNNRINKVILIIICIIVILFFIYALLCNSRSYKLNLPNIENLVTISLKQDNVEKLISDKEEIKSIMDILKRAKGKTNRESVQDFPVNVEKIIKIDFKLKNEGTSTMYIYSKNNKYYIEQPYNGIYNITSNEYFEIECHI